jgi:hypothetical protein
VQVLIVGAGRRMQGRGLKRGEARTTILRRNNRSSITGCTAGGQLLQHLGKTPNKTFVVN